MKVKLYVEGGGDANRLRTLCRQGFGSFFRKAGLKGRMPRIVACGSRQKAFRDFRTALTETHAEGFIALLVDAEAPIGNNVDPRRHLEAHDKWKAPERATKDQVHLMVQCMESWFLADQEALASYFGDGFKSGALPANPDTEQISKADVFAGLKSATRDCESKGAYDKGNHAFMILEVIDPEKVQKASPSTRRLIGALMEKAGA